MHEVTIQTLQGVLLSRTLAPSRERGGDAVEASFVAVEVLVGDNVLDVKKATPHDGKVVVSTTRFQSATVTVEQLVADVTAFLSTVSTVSSAATTKKPRRLCIVAHDTKPLLAAIADVTRDVRIRQLGDVHHGDLKVVEANGVKWRVSLLDTQAFFGDDHGAGDIAATVGFPTIEQQIAGLAASLGADEARRFVTQGWNVAAIAAGFDRFRTTMKTRWGVEPLRNRTLASLAGRIFRRMCKTGPAPWKNRTVVKKRATRSGFRDERRREKVFAGKPAVRLAAARAYWGGLMAAFVRGLAVQPLVELDAISLYPHCAIIQALPYQRTRWREITGVGDVAHVEGFVKVQFEYPERILYPFLPVGRDGVNRLLFTRRGVSTCTTSELRLALRLGAQVRILDSHVFVPGNKEREHDVAAFMREMLADKAKARKGTIEYQIPKLLANALIGKLGERLGGSSLLDLEREALNLGYGAGFAATVASTPALHQALKRTTDAGSMFAVEWASLIVGRGRAIMGDICAKGEPLLVSTDAILVPPDTDLSCPGLDELRSVGSDLRREYAADAAFIARTRCYALLKRPENVKPGEEVFGANDDWCVIRTARHGSDETEHEFAATTLACLKAGRDVAPERTRVRRLGAQEAVRRGMRINDEFSAPHRTGFRWDGKRRLLKRDANLFTTLSETSPYDTVGALESAERQSNRAEARSNAAAARKLRTVLRLLSDGLTVEEVARQTKVPLQKVSEIERKMPRDGSSTP